MLNWRQRFPSSQDWQYAKHLTKEGPAPCIHFDWCRGHTIGTWRHFALQNEGIAPTPSYLPQWRQSAALWQCQNVHWCVCSWNSPNSTHGNSQNAVALYTVPLQRTPPCCRVRTSREVARNLTMCPHEWTPRTWMSMQYLKSTSHDQ